MKALAIAEKPFGIESQHVEMIPITVVSPGSEVSLETLFHNYAARDDVWNEDFARCRLTSFKYIRVWAELTVKFKTSY